MLITNKSARLPIVRCGLSFVLFSSLVFAHPHVLLSDNRASYDQGFVYVRTTTDYPFSLFPALGGADKTK